MNLNNFESYFDEIIIERGLDYYESGSVVSLEYYDGEWVAEVSGSRDYTVKVTLSENGEITNTYCDCPYDMGEYCKHQAAVFYTLRDEIESGELASKKKKNKNLEELLEKLDKKNLVSMLMEYAGKNKHMKDELLLRCDKQGDILKYARNVIQSSIGNVKYRGFIEYADAAYAVSGADTILYNVNDKIDSGDISTAISLCFVILEEMVELIGYCDDSGGDVGRPIAEAIGKIGEAVFIMESDQNNIEKIFDMIFNHALEKRYNGWPDWRIDLLYTLLPLCGNNTNRNKMEKYLSYQNAEKDNGVRKYEEHQRQKLQYEILRKFDSKKAADSYMEQHMDNSDFREAVIQNAISRGFYKKALNLCLDGEHNDNSYAGLVRKWKELRYTVYEKSEDIQGQKTLGMELLQGNFEYFNKFKALYNKKEWPGILKTILEKLWNTSRNNVYVKVLIKEDIKPQLLEYCKKYNDSITFYYKHLLPDYKDDIGKIFEKYIKEKASFANSRGSYRNVCEIIQSYKKACGNVAYKLRGELAKEYIRRPAFLDELSRL